MNGLNQAIIAELAHKVQGLQMRLTVEIDRLREKIREKKRYFHECNGSRAFLCGEEMQGIAGLIAEIQEISEALDALNEFSPFFKKFGGEK